MNAAQPQPELVPQEGLDALGDLEERITRAVELVNALRKQNAELEGQLEAANALATSAATEARAARQELDELRTERRQVRTRIEKLLGQLDLLSTA